MQRKKTAHEIAKSFFVRQGEIAILFGISRAMAVRAFNSAQEFDKKMLGENYLDNSLVRLSSVLLVLGISEEELLRKTEA